MSIRTWVLFPLVFAACSSAPAQTQKNAPRTSPGKRVAAPQKSTATPAAPSQEEARSVDRIQEAYARGAFEESLVEGETFVKNHPRSRYLPAVRNLQGLGHLALKQSEAAAGRFKEAVELSSQGESRTLPFYQYNLATAQFDSNSPVHNPAEAWKTLSSINADKLDSANRAKLFYLRARTLQKLGRFDESLVEVVNTALTLSSLATGANELRNALTVVVRTGVEGAKDLAAAENGLKGFEKTPIEDDVLFYLGKRAAAERKPGAAETYFRTLLAAHPQSPHYPEAQSALDQPSLKKGSASRTVGALLPLSGKYGKFGQQALRGLMLALDLWSTQSKGTTLYVEDSGETAEDAVKALEKLYADHEVLAVVGPLSSKGIEPVTRRAQELGLPLLSLAQQAGVKGDYIFQGQATPRQQARAVAHWAMQKGGMKRFAILYPSNRFGEESAQAFWDTVEQLGGTVVGYEGYSPEDTDFRGPVDRLVGTAFPESRQRELDELARLRKTDNITKRNRVTEKYFSLPPIVDFDAVFIPDESRVVTQIMPTFAYRDVEQLKYLGISTWNSPSLIERAPVQSEGAVFVDAYSPRSSHPDVKEFISRYTAQFGAAPGLFEAIGYDMGKLLQSQIQKGITDDRSELRTALSQLKNHPAVTGALSYEDGQLVHRLKAFTVQKKEFVELGEVELN